MSNFISRILTHKITKNIFIMIIISFVLIISTSIYLRFYTHHSQKIFTPSFKGLTLEEAYKIADDKGIEIEIIDSVYEAYGTPGTVIDQTPKSNFLIKKGRKIFIVIKAFTKKVVKMPDLRDVSLIQARSVLETNGLMVGKITYRMDPENPHLVLAQQMNGKDVPPGKELIVGTKIDLIVGEGDGSVAIVPDLTGLTLKQATFKIADCYLNLGIVIFDKAIVSAKDSAESVVWKQTPSPDAKLEYGQKVDIWLTTGE